MTINGREQEKLTALAEWLDQDPLWLRHVWENEFDCNCEFGLDRYDGGYEHSYCLTWKKHLEAADAATKALQQKQREERLGLEVTHQRERREMLAELDRQGLLP
jgi:hypothetical protein